MLALLATLVLLFAFQGEAILRPLHNPPEAQQTMFQ